MLLLSVESGVQLCCAVCVVALHGGGESTMVISTLARKGSRLAVLLEPEPPSVLLRQGVGRPGGTEPQEP